MPRMQFSTIYTRAESVTAIDGQRALIKDAIQWGLDRLTDASLPYLNEEGFLTTVAPYETGTVTATNASKTVTGSGTTFTAAMAGRKIRMGSDNAYYRIKTFVSTTEVTLEAPYDGTTGSGKTYSIYKDEYRLLPDVDRYKVLRHISDNVALGSLISFAFDLVEPSPSSEGAPSWEILAGTKLDIYTTGTVSGTVNASTITGSSTAWTSVEGLARGSRIVIGTNVYTVKSVDSDTSITIYEDLLATVSSGTAYTIHLDNLIIQLTPIPDAAENIYYRYQRFQFPLFNDEDIPDLPEKYHDLLLVYALGWLWSFKDKEESTRMFNFFEKEKIKMWNELIPQGGLKILRRRSMDTLYFGRRLGPPRAIGYDVPIEL